MKSRRRGEIPAGKEKEMGKFEYEWWHVDIKVATGKYTYEFKAKSKDGAVKQIKKYEKEHNDEVRRVRPDFKTEVFWDTLHLDRKGYQRLY